jgi:predicted MPP superfamily phosphohydrolase
LTGDFVSGTAAPIYGIAPELARLAVRLGAFAVLGNHDHLTDAETVSRVLTGHGIRMLTNQAVEPAPGLWLAGLDDGWTGRPDVTDALRGVPPEVCPILLTHNPNLCRRAMVRPMLILCGHTHGGQVYVRGVTERLMPGIRNTGYLRGWYPLNGGWIYVNRGIGTINLPIRLFARAEVALFTLRAAPLTSSLHVRSIPR